MALSSLTGFYYKLCRLIGFELNEDNFGKTCEWVYRFKLRDYVITWENSNIDEV